MDWKRGANSFVSNPKESRDIPFVIDIHTHVLPCLDDGPETIEESLRMCSMAARDGITTMVATPHMLCDVGNPDAGVIRRACRNLREALAKAGIAIDVRYAAEVRMVEELPARVKAGEIPLLDPEGRHLLLEPPLTGGRPEHICEVIFRLRLDGVVPVIAHPERCEMFAADPTLVQRVVDQGALIQVNAAAIAKTAPETDVSPVVEWLHQGLVHVVASDAHDAMSRPPLLSTAAVTCSDILGKNRSERLFSTNPALILAGREIESAGGTAVNR